MWPRGGELYQPASDAFEVVLTLEIEDRDAVCVSDGDSCACATGFDAASSVGAATVWGPTHEEFRGIIKVRPEYLIGVACV